MTLNLSMPNAPFELKPKITVVGVGGAGGNAVNNMIKQNLEGVDFIVANTDAQALAQSLCQRRIQLGQSLTSGLGAGSRPDVGRAAAEEALDEIIAQLQGSNMVFITAGMGGGTGTGAGPVIAAATREQGILTVGVVTKPFHFEGLHRMRIADAGIQEMQQFVDTLIIIPNQNLFRIANEKTTFADAFNMADQVLDCGVRGVTDLMVKPGLINLDFADIRAVMTEMGKAMMGTGEAEGPNRAIGAAEAAISNPLLDDVSMKGARGVLINITGGLDMTLFEVDEAANRIRSEVDPEANIIFGSTFDPTLEGKVRISVVATGIDGIALQQPRPVSLSLVTGTGRSVPAPAERQEPGMVASHPAGGMEIRRETAGANALAAQPVTMAAPAYAPDGAGGRSPDDAAGHGRPPDNHGSAGHGGPAGPVAADGAARGPADGPGGEAFRGPPAGATDAPGPAAGNGPPDGGGTPDGPAGSPGAPENAQSFQSGNGKRLVAGHGGRDAGAGHPAASGQPGAAAGGTAARPRSGGPCAGSPAACPCRADLYGPAGRRLSCGAAGAAAAQRARPQGSAGHQPGRGGSA